MVSIKRSGGQQGCRICIDKLIRDLEGLIDHASTVATPQRGRLCSCRLHWPDADVLGGVHMPYKSCICLCMRPTWAVCMRAAKVAGCGVCMVRWYYFVPLLQGVLQVSSVSTHMRDTDSCQCQSTSNDTQKSCCCGVAAVTAAYMRKKNTFTTRADAPSWGRALALAGILNHASNPCSMPCTIGQSRLKQGTHLHKSQCPLMR